MMHLPRPRDPDASARPKGQRTVASYRRSAKEWVVDCYAANGVWQWTMYDQKPMSRKVAERMACELNAITKKKIVWGTWRKKPAKRKPTK